MFHLKRSLLLGSIAVMLLAGLVYTSHTRVFSTAFAATSSCGWVQKSNWETPAGVNIIKWEDTCPSPHPWHCEAIDNIYWGGAYTIELDAYNASGVLVAHTTNWTLEFIGPTPSYPSMNTPNLSGYSSYECDGYTVAPL